MANGSFVALDAHLIDPSNVECLKKNTGLSSKNNSGCKLMRFDENGVLNICHIGGNVNCPVFYKALGVCRKQVDSNQS